MPYGRRRGQHKAFFFKTDRYRPPATNPHRHAAEPPALAYHRLFLFPFGARFTVLFRGYTHLARPMPPCTSPTATTAKTMRGDAGPPAWAYHQLSIEGVKRGGAGLAALAHVHVGAQVAQRLHDDVGGGGVEARGDLVQEHHLRQAHSQLACMRGI